MGRALGPADQGLCLVAVEAAGTHMTTTGYLLGMGTHDFLPHELHGGTGAGGGAEAEAEAGGVYFGVHVLAQRPPCA
jgi:hypothetical protein